MKMGLVMKWAHSVSILTILTMIPKSASFPSYQGSVCPDDDAKSDYEFRLNAVLNSLSSNATNPAGFSTASFGSVVYGLFLCRGDLNSSSCKDCVTTAVSDLTKTYCPKKKVAYIWYYECMLRYSNETFFGKMEPLPGFRYRRPQNGTGNLTLYSEFVWDLLDKVSSKAAESSSRKFGTDREVYSGSSQTLYALAQCTQDLTNRACRECLNYAIGQVWISQGSWTWQPNCHLRYENYPFFSLLALQPSPPPPPLPRNTTEMTTPVIRPPQAHRKKLSSTGVVIAIFAPALIVIVVLLALGFFLINKKVNKHDVVIGETDEDFSAFESLQYDLDTLQSATNNFSDENKLGQGGFGCVYKGTLLNGCEVAVKKLSLNSCQGVQEFKNEALLVAKLQHRNLVKLLGFCLDGQEKLLVYEYVPNKSLDNFLFEPKKQSQLSWERRYKIIKGIARGMVYIHQDSQLRIIHRDLKASNILLDADMNPKISDFGMARIFNVDEIQASTKRVVGTYGYMSPEYAMRGQYSVKSDVYSFVILILEIISGKRNSAFHGSDDEDLLGYAWRQWIKGLPLEFVDPAIRDTCLTHEVVRCLHLGLLCAQESVDARPTMGTIVLTLDSYSVTLPLPQQPSLTIKSITKSNPSEASGSDQLVSWSQIDAR